MRISRLAQVAGITLIASLIPVLGAQSAFANTYSYSVTYNSGGGIGSVDAQSGTLSCDNEDTYCRFNLRSNGFTNGDKFFNGWIDGEGHYFREGELITLYSNQNLVLTAQWASHCEITSAHCEIGDIGPGGGRVFITPDTEGNSTGKYFEVAPIQSGRFYWCSDGMDEINSARATAIGDGPLNMAAMIDYGCATGSSIDYLTHLTLGGYSDWILPTLDEMHAMSNSQTKIGMYQADYILSSTYSRDDQFSTWHFSMDFQVNLDVTWAFLLAPVRSFSLDSASIAPMLPDPVQTDTLTTSCLLYTSDAADD